MYDPIRTVEDIARRLVLGRTREDDHLDFKQVARAERQQATGSARDVAEKAGWFTGSADPRPISTANMDRRAATAPDVMTA